MEVQEQLVALQLLPWGEVVVEQAALLHRVERQLMEEVLFLLCLE